jgi:hypothetical protein
MIVDLLFDGLFVCFLSALEIGSMAATPGVR